MLYQSNQREGTDIGPGRSGKPVLRSCQCLSSCRKEPTLYASSADTSKLHELERTKTSLRSDAVGRTARCEQPSDKIDAPARVVKDKVGFFKSRIVSA